MKNYASTGSGFISRYLAAVVALFAALIPVLVFASEAVTADTPDLTSHTVGYLALAIFAAAYLLVTAEEFTHLRKSKPVIIAAGLIWGMIGWVSTQAGLGHAAEAAARHNLLEYAELMLFLLVAMTYINAMEERQVFNALRSWLVRKGFGFRTLFWLTGMLAFIISPVADNLTTALLMCAVVLAVGGDNARFVTIACINIVVGANAGGAFSPFGDITTLMVWQKGLVSFTQFFDLLIPSIVNWLIPAVIMSFAVPTSQPQQVNEQVDVKPGGYLVVLLFLLTIVLAVSLHTFLHLPPVLGMMTGLGMLKIFGYFIRREELSRLNMEVRGPEDANDLLSHKTFDIFKSLKRAEWDTLMFFYGVILCVGGLGTLGYLGLVSEFFYQGFGATWANIAVGVLSAIVDNIPVMFAVLTMNPDMSLGQWLLVTLTAGVGGSLLSIGSAAGVALMGQARGVYTFFAHLKWTWAIALGYAASIWVHLLINAKLM